jgi:LacI family transcriptional regulator
MNSRKKNIAATAKDVARLAGVSPSTVSRVINNDERISTETRQKVVKCINTLDYKVNNIARSLKTKQTHTIGFIAPEISEEFFMRIAKGAENILQQNGYSLIICNANDNLKDETNRIRLLQEKQVDGVIITPSTNEGKNYQILRKAGIPVVLADRLVNNFEANTVLVDNINGAYSAIEHIINLGAKRIGFIGGKEISVAQERYEGYKRALKDYNIPLDQEVIKFGDFHVDSGYQLMKELLAMETPPQHLFISNYYMHVGAVKYLIEKEVKTPFSIGISSFDDMHLSALLGHASVTVSQPIIEIGETAARLLLKRIKEKGARVPFQTTRLKTKLIYYQIEHIK